MTHQGFRELFHLEVKGMISIHDGSLNQIHPNEVLDGTFSAEKDLLLAWACQEAEDPVLGEKGRCLAEPGSGGKGRCLIEPALVEPGTGLGTE